MELSEIEEIRKNKKDRRVYKSRKIKDYRELVNYSIKNYADHIAYEYKKKPTDKTIITKTYEQTGKDIKAFSTALLNKGLRGKKIAVIGRNRYEWCVSYLAVTTGDMIIVPLDRALTEKEIGNLIRRSEAEVIICDSSFVDAIKKLKESKETKLKTIISMDTIEDKNVENWEDVLKAGTEAIKDGDKKYDEIELDPTKLAIILFTSGTTSEAKGVMLSQRNVCTNIEDMASYSKMYDNDTILSVLPLHHTFECTISFLYGFYSGVTIAFCDGLRYYADNLKEYHVSIIVAVPVLLEAIYKKITTTIKEQGKEEQVKKAIKLANFLDKLHINARRKIFKSVIDSLGGRLRILYYGAAQMEKDTILGFENFGIPSVQGYGLTETSPIITAESDREHRPGSVGFVFPALNIRIDNPDKDGIGEVAVKGGSVMLGYYQDEKKTAEVMHDGWFSTGDYGFIDDDEFLHLTGRKHDIIVLRNGKNVYPEEIEGLINKLPYVTESLVFPRNNDKTDTLLCAQLVYDKKEFDKLYPDQNCEEVAWKDIKELNKSLPTFKHVKRIIVTDEPMEKTTTQKIKRAIAIEKAEKELAKKEKAE